MATLVTVHSALLTSPSSRTNPLSFSNFTPLRQHQQYSTNIITNSLTSPSSSSSLVRVVPRSRKLSVLSAMVTGKLMESLPPVLDSTSEPPPLFDGTTRLYISYTCPFAQRVWIARNYKGLQDTIKLVPIDLTNRPAWYKEKVYPGNKVPSLEHNNEVRGESLDLIKYIDAHFEGPPLLPDDPAKRDFAEELISYCDTFNSTVRNAFSNKGDIDSEIGGSLDYLESALSKFNDGPFFLGQFSMVDIAYAPFLERYGPFFVDVKKYDITKGRSKLASWIEEMDKIEAYTQTKRDPKELLEIYKQRYGVN